MRTLLRKRESPAENGAAEPAAADAPAEGAATNGAAANGAAANGAAADGAAPAGPPADAPAPLAAAPATCRSCGAAMVDGQDWCLECGTAAPGRLGQRPGWRLGAVVLALTLLLVGGAAVAGYAAVTGDAERQTAAQNPAPGTPVPAPVPTPPAPAEPTSEPPKVETPDPAPTADVTPPADDFTLPTPAPDDTTIDPVTPLPDTTPDTTVPDTTGGSEALEPYTIKSDDLEVYNPYDRAGAEFGDPKDALNDDEPFFDVTVPADGEPIGAGLQVDLAAVRTISEITFRTTTPGMGIEIYGVKTGKPSGLRAGWRQLAQQELPSGERDITITLDGEQEIRRLVLWFTTPANADDPRASVGRLEVLG